MPRMFWGLHKEGEPEIASTFAHWKKILMHVKHVLKSSYGRVPWISTNCCTKKKDLTPVTSVIKASQRKTTWNGTNLYTLEKNLTHVTGVLKASQGKRTWNCTNLYTLEKKLTLYTRVAQLHTDIALECWVCLKCFSRESHLIDHVRRHTGEKPEKCPQCDQCFATFRELRSHVSRCQLPSRQKKSINLPICQVWLTIWNLNGSSYEQVR